MSKFSEGRLQHLAIGFMADESDWGKEVNALISDYVTVVKQNKMLAAQNAEMSRLIAVIGDHADYIKEKTWAYQQDNCIRELNDIDSSYTDRGGYDDVW